MFEEAGLKSIFSISFLPLYDCVWENEHEVVRLLCLHMCIIKLGIRSTFGRIETVVDWRTRVPAAEAMETYQ